MNNRESSDDERPLVSFLGVPAERVRPHFWAFTGCFFITLIFYIYAHVFDVDNPSWRQAPSLIMEDTTRAAVFWALVSPMVVEGVVMVFGWLLLEKKRQEGREEGRAAGREEGRERDAGRQAALRPTPSGTPGIGAGCRPKPTASPSPNPRPTRATVHPERRCGAEPRCGPPCSRLRPARWSWKEWSWFLAGCCWRKSDRKAERRAGRQAGKKAGRQAALRPTPSGTPGIGAGCRPRRTASPSPNPRPARATVPTAGTQEAVESRAPSHAGCDGPCQSMCCRLS